MYSEILEHVSFDMGQRYLDVIRDDPHLMSAARLLSQSDNIGLPKRYTYTSLGPASPTTLRYLKVAHDLRSLFGSLDGFAITEIGIGYGGQCRVLCALNQPAEYSLIDLPEVLALTSRFLGDSRVTIPLNLDPPDASVTRHSDLLISNYAFSELRRDIQESYMNRYVDHAKRGYMTFNRIGPRGFDSMPVQEFAMRVGGQVVKESPSSFPGNRVVYWGAKVDR